jgi:hypothetical protein
MKLVTRFTIVSLIVVLTYFFKYKTKELSINNFEKNNLNNITTIISVYFPFPSKHSKDKYARWIKNFVNSVSSPLAIFTDETSKDYILKLKPDLKLHTIFYLYENVWDVLKQLENERNKNYKEKYMLEQYDKDPEKKIHNPNLYGVWNIKAFITNKIAEENPFNSSFFIYTDIGAFRDQIIQDWPDKNFIKSLSNRLKNKVLFGQIQEFTHDPNDFKNSFISLDLIEGGFFAGNKKAIKNFKTSFYNLHDELLEQGIFIGKDQKIMNLYTFKNNKNEVVRMRTWNVSCSKSYDQWFLYQRFLASDTFYQCYDNKFSLLIDF